MRYWALLALLALTVPAPAEEPVDLNAVHRIRTEAFENSKVMNHLFYLTDVHGPRLTSSPGFLAAAGWAVEQLKSWGLAGVKQEKWGPFGRGWSYTRFQAALITPGYQPLIGFPLAWAPGTNGALIAEPVLAPIRAEADFARWKGKLKGKIVLIDNPRDTPMQTAAAGRRHGPGDLQALFIGEIPSLAGSSETDQSARGPAGEPRQIGPDARRGPREFDSEERRRQTSKRNQFLKDEGVVAFISTGYRGDGGTVFATSAGYPDPKYTDPPPAVVITPEHYNRIVRLLEKKVPVTVSLDVEARLHTETTDSFNIVADIAGGRKKDEVVMIGAHFDSWHGGTGATDNGAGSAVMMEAMRILKATNLPLDRTVRLALWSGEELGLLGSKAYVKEHFADPETMSPTSAHAKLAAYFNYDNGTGKIRGVYLQGNDMVRPIFEAWLKPFQDLGATGLTIRNTAGTDHLSFDAVGLPGFQFIQDPVEYASRTHHSNMDVYDHIQETDVKQASAVVASFAYHAANRAEPLPRKPLPKPKPKKKEAAAAKP